MQLLAPRLQDDRVAPLTTEVLRILPSVVERQTMRIGAQCS